MTAFAINEDRCTQCGLCVDDCPAGALSMQDLPVLDPERCFGCQHCLAVCPEAALSIQGADPDQSIPLQGNLPTGQAMATLVKGRRSVRQYKNEGVDPALIAELLETAWHAPTAVNNQSVQATVLDTLAATDALRGEIYARLETTLPGLDLDPDSFLARYLVRALKLRKESGRDMIFRGAPHVVVASAPKGSPAPETDAHIFLSYFELLASASGLGAVWNGMLRYCLDLVFPDLRARLGIPDDHVIGGVIAFGTPSVEYHRTVQRTGAKVHRVAWPAS